jgi:copper(I)-binding protein
MLKRTLVAAAALALALAGGALAGTPVKVEGAWVRSTVPGQQGTTAFMKLTSQQPMQVVGVSSPVAGTADLHEMKREGEVMTMRPLAKLDLPAGRTVALTPSGYHLMLQDLKLQLKPGTTVPVTLMLQDAKGVKSQLELKLPVAVRAPATGAAPPTDGRAH